jgi:serine phosphatase RsbU (regulator of sigma subunit)
VVGDVCGHGPAEAALGVALRIAWRTMTLAGVGPAETLAAMEQVLLHERDESLPFATVCDVTVDPGTHELTVRRHGHPPPLLLAPAARWVEEAPAAPPLACVGPRTATAVTVPLPPDWGFLLLTDGIFEGHAGEGRLGMDGLAVLVEQLLADGTAGAGPEWLLDRLVAATRELNGGDLDDDIALLWIGARVGVG